MNAERTMKDADAMKNDHAIRAGHSANSSRGFTLLELLVSMTIVSLLATTVLFGWRIAAGAWGKADRLIEDQRRAAATQALLEQQMAGMVPYTPWASKGMPDVFFQGEGQTARFLSRYSLESRARSGLYRIEYQILKNSDGAEQLVMNETAQQNPDSAGALLTGTEKAADGGTLLHFAPFARSANTRVLLDGLKEAHFEYYRPAGPSTPAGWVTGWTSRGGELPRAMAIRVTAAGSASDDGAPGPLVSLVSIVAGIEDFALVPPAARRR
jgi:prepilin-type N-terminal cleavage/methylation domain-containing protein